MRTNLRSQAARTPSRWETVRDRPSPTICTSQKSPGPPPQGKGPKPRPPASPKANPTTSRPSKERVSILRNKERENEANAKDREILASKYLQTNTSEFLPPPIEGPGDTYSAPPVMLENIKRVFAASVPTPKKSTICFATDPISLQHNSDLLEGFGFDLERLIQAEADTTLGYGSEFRPLAQLKLVIGNHPNFQELEKVLEHGMDYRFKRELTEAERAAETDAIIIRGNHRSIEHNQSATQKLLAKDVEHGFSLPINPHTVPFLVGAQAQSLGIVSQTTIDGDGNRKLKHRLTQDLSFAITLPDASINERVDMEAYPEMIYGWCLLRILHYIAALRLKHPGEKIYISKYDYSDAYRRMCHGAKAAA